MLRRPLRVDRPASHWPTPTSSLLFRLSCDSLRCAVAWVAPRPLVMVLAPDLRVGVVHRVLWLLLAPRALDVGALRPASVVCGAR